VPSARPHPRQLGASRPDDRRFASGSNPACFSLICESAVRRQRPPMRPRRRSGNLHSFARAGMSPSKSPSGQSQGRNRILDYVRSDLRPSAEPGAHLSAVSFEHSRTTRRDVAFIILCGSIARYRAASGFSTSSERPLAEVRTRKRRERLRWRYGLSARGPSTRPAETIPAFEPQEK
jgi:hypothetical protein